jgi:hypothetical protein
MIEIRLHSMIACNELSALSEDRDEYYSRWLTRQILGSDGYRDYSSTSTFTLHWGSHLNAQYNALKTQQQFYQK